MTQNRRHHPARAARQVHVQIRPVLDGDVFETDETRPAHVDERHRARPAMQVVHALELTGGKKGEAAKILGISHPTLNKKIEDYGIVKP